MDKNILIKRINNTLNELLEIRAVLLPACEDCGEHKINCQEYKIRFPSGNEVKVKHLCFDCYLNYSLR